MIRPDFSDNFGSALLELLKRVESEFHHLDKSVLPVRMIIAGGAALYLHTAERATEDVDATFSRRVILGDIEVAYRDPDGRAAFVYLDRNYNDTLGLMHEDADHDALAVDVKSIRRSILDVRVLTPLDLAVSKLARFSDQDREDILLLAKREMIDAPALRKRAEAAMKAYVGNIEPVRNTIDIVCRLIESPRPATKKARKR